MPASDTSHISRTLMIQLINSLLWSRKKILINNFDAHSTRDVNLHFYIQFWINILFCTFNAFKRKISQLQIKVFHASIKKSGRIWCFILRHLTKSKAWKNVVIGNVSFASLHWQLPIINPWKKSSKTPPSLIDKVSHLWIKYHI